MKIVHEATNKAPFHVGMDMYEAPPYSKPLTEEEEREATVTLIGSLLDGGYSNE